ncbi:reverse transcriptase [Streptococcus pyogenes]|nr:reverse transcriptase [Streptococcus pyogenes]
MSLRHQNKKGIRKEGWKSRPQSRWSDHCQLVAQKSVLKQAISKTVLAERGLFSCLADYLERHALKVN